MRHFLIFFFAVAVGNAWGQATEKHNSVYVGFYRAEDLFQKEQYSAAKKEFRLFLDQYKGSKNDPYYVKGLYYEGLSALELFNNDAVQLLEQFNREYPESIYKYDIYLRIGRYYYQKKDYVKALEWFTQLKRQDVEPANVDEYFFKMGYSYFHEKNYTEAKGAFFEVKDATTQYGAPSLYYYSHICYMDGSYQSALEGFQKLMSDARFNSVVPYYITQIYYLQGNYEEVTKFAPALVDSLKPGEQVEMNHLIGDAYYKIGKFDEAVPYLEQYNEKAATTRDDDYQLAYSYFKSSAYGKAVKYFDKVARVKDTLGQIALYHAGECYLNLNELAYARTAFEAASQLDMDLMIQEDALYNFAILSYKLDLNPYDESVVALETYLNKYPDSPRKNVVYQYLVSVYTSTKNYQKALESLDRVPNKDLKLRSAYQLIAFNRGIELYQKADYAGAIAAFELVKRYPVNNDISAKGVFYTGEAQFQMKQYTAAIQSYRVFNTMPSTYLSGLRADAYYNIGYALLAIDDKDKTQTIEAFRNYLQQPNLSNKHKKADAMMRLADCYYVTRKNTEAIDMYNQAYNLKAGYEDQALFFMARLYGFEKQREKKIQQLQDIINNYPNSKYMLSSIYEVAVSYYNGGNNDKAMRYFEQVVKDYPTSIQVKDALHYIGDIYFKKNDYATAETYFNRVLNQYGNDRATCAREVQGLIDIYTAQHNLSKVDQLAAQYPCAEINTDQLEDNYFVQAKEANDTKNYAQTITEADTYLAKYPSGKYKAEILNYKANSLYELKREGEAIDIYKQTLDGPNDDFTEIAAQRTAKFLYNGGQHEAALPYYARLEQVAKKPEMIYLATLGLMRCHFLLENYANSAEYARKVLTNTQITNTVRLEAEFAKGVSLTKTNQFAEAMPSLEYVIKNTTTAMGAEAKYTMAEGYFNKSDLTKADAEIRALLKMKPAYDYWIAKGLMLQTKILMAKNDLFQAENTILSVIDNYPVQDDGILTEAGELYDEVMQLKNTPKKIQEKSGTVIEIEAKEGKNQ